MLVRPSFVLGGRGMAIIYDEKALNEYLESSGIAAEGAGQGPLLIDRFLDDAIEIDVDALYDGTELFLGGVMEHVEEAGVHSGDSSCVIPPMTLSQARIRQIRKATEAIAAGVGVRGLINIQFALLSGVLYVIEANPRASRTVPFVSKATGVSLAKAAARVMIGRTIAQLKEEGMLPAKDATEMVPGDPTAVKEAVLPFKRFLDYEGKVVDTILGPEMRSTGEVMGFDKNFPIAFAKSLLAVAGEVPSSGKLFISVADRDKRALVLPALQLSEMGFELCATKGTAAVLARNGIDCEVVRKASDGRGEDGEPTIVDMIHDSKIAIVVNTPGSQGSRADGYDIRTATTSAGKPIITTMQQLTAYVRALSIDPADFQVASLQEYAADRIARRNK